MKAKKEKNKFLVLKNEDIENYFSQFTRGLFTTDVEKKYMESIPYKEVIEDLKNNKKYIVINQDEPYAELIWQMIILGEDAKKANHDEKRLKRKFSEFMAKIYQLGEKNRTNLRIRDMILEEFPFMKGEI